MPSFFYRLSLSLALIFLAFAGKAQAQTGPVGLEQDSSPREESLDKSFTPHWSGQLGFTRFGQPSNQGGGQTQTDLGFTATDNLSEGGNFFSLGASAGSQKVEGNQSAYGALSVGAGLGIGLFSPSLIVEGQYGQANLKTYSGTLNLDFQPLEALTLGLSLGGGFQGHQRPVSKSTGTVSTKNWTTGLNATFQAFEDLGFNASFQQQTDITYSYQSLLLGIIHTQSVNQADRIPSVTLGVDWDFVKDFTLEGTGEFGQEFYPAGTFYSPILGETVTTTKPTSQNFAGYSLALVWNFDIR
jgi:hypothetical protein